MLAGFLINGADAVVIKEVTPFSYVGRNDIKIYSHRSDEWEDETWQVGPLVADWLNEIEKDDLEELPDEASFYDPENGTLVVFGAESYCLEDFAETVMDFAREHKSDVPVFVEYMDRDEGSGYSGYKYNVPISTVTSGSASPDAS